MTHDMGPKTYLMRSSARDHMLLTEHRYLTMRERRIITYSVVVAVAVVVTVIHRHVKCTEYESN